MISMDKQYTTRDGRPVRVLCVDAGDEYPVVLLTESDALRRYRPDGRWFESGDDNQKDLIEVKPKRTVEVWINHYEDGSPVAHLIEPKPEHKNDRCIATTHHTITSVSYTHLTLPTIYSV